MALAASFRVRKGDLAKIDKMLKSVSPKHNKRIRKDALTRCAYLVQKISTEEMFIRGKRKAPPDKPPKKLTDRHGGSGLIGSIAVDLPKEGIATVGTHLAYGAVHEFGRGRYPKRAFLSPALKKASKKFGDIFVETINRELRR